MYRYSATVINRSGDSADSVDAKADKTASNQNGLIKNSEPHFPLNMQIYVAMVCFTIFSSLGSENICKTHGQLFRGDTSIITVMKRCISPLASKSSQINH
jgi:hypothetical protein